MSKHEIKKSHFNVFDVLIIVAVLACIAAVVLRARFAANAATSEVCGFDFVISSVLPDTAEKTEKSLEGGKKLYLSSDDTEIGYILSASACDTKVCVAGADGALHEVIDPTRKDIVGECIFYGSYNDLGFYIGGNRLATVGDTLIVYSDTMEFSVTITGMYEVK